MAASRYEARRQRLRKRYLARRNLTEADIDAIRAKQGNACAICRAVDRKLLLDMDHATGRLRGLLCRRCDVGLALLNDETEILRRALDYLA